MPSDRRPPGTLGALKLRFLWVPAGEEPDPAALAQFQEPVRIPARLVRRRREQEPAASIAPGRSPAPPVAGSVAPRDDHSVAASGENAGWQIACGEPTAAER